MTEFTVHLANRPGMLAALAALLADAGITVEAVAAFGLGSEGVAHLVVDDAAATRAVLEAAATPYEERTVLVTMLSHEPGALATMTRRMADTGVNIEAMYLLRSSVEGREYAVAIDRRSVSGG